MCGKPNLENSRIFQGTFGLLLFFPRIFQALGKTLSIFQDFWRFPEPVRTLFQGQEIYSKKTKLFTCCQSWKKKKKKNHFFLSSL